jgi:hypothetical protein
MTARGTRSIRIAGGSAFWGDSNASLQKLIGGQQLDYLMLEYLAEITMALLARVRAKSAEAGYVPDFIAAMSIHLHSIKAQGIKVITNAGGMNPAACARALHKLAEEKGISLSIAVVEGDDLIARADEFRRLGIGDWRTNAPLPPTDRLLSINAYLGATPIAAALAAGADVVITGRGVDSALALGPLMHEFGWKADDFDRLAAGSLCGHLIECGPQATGGNFTDWDTVPGWQDIGYPIAECAEDGTFVITKPAGTGGLVSSQTVGEQLLYEIDDPASYLLPDVTVDLRRVTLTQVGPDRVSVQGARGRPPTSSYKATVTSAGGYRSTALFMIGGIDAVAKGHRTAAAILSRCRRIFGDASLGDFEETSIEVLGAEATYGDFGRANQAREVMVKIAVKHASKVALELFTQEIAPTSIAMAPGITGFYGGRPKVTPVICGASLLVAKTNVPVSVVVDGKEVFHDSVASPWSEVPASELQPIDAASPAEATVDVPLVQVAHARSGDKGNDALIAVLARKPEYLPHIARSLSAEKVAQRFRHVLSGKVVRYDVPGTNAFIFQLLGALGGGGLASLRMDPQGKAFAQMLLDAPIAVPASWIERHGLHRVRLAMTEAVA